MKAAPPLAAAQMIRNYLKAFKFSTEEKKLSLHICRDPQKSSKGSTPDFSGDRGGRVLRTKIFKTLLPEAILMIQNVIEDSKKLEPNTRWRISKHLHHPQKKKILSPRIWQEPQKSPKGPPWFLRWPRRKSASHHQDLQKSSLRNNSNDQKSYSWLKEAITKHQMKNLKAFASFTEEKNLITINLSKAPKIT